MRESTDARTGHFIVRRATRADAKTIVDLVTGLATYERLDPPNAKGRVRLVKDIFDRKRVKVFIATTGREIAGYALYFYTYSTFLARPTLYLEDISVSEDYRRLGVGKALFVRCVREAKRRGCGRMEWAVLTWNRKAIDFYKRHGAETLDDQRIYRLHIK